MNPETVLDKLSEIHTSADNRRALSALLAAMPIQGRYSELRVHAHSQPNRKLKPSDGRDYYAIASMSPFVDYLVTDKSMYLLAEAAGFNNRNGATIMRRLTDLREQLKHDLTTGALNPGRTHSIAAPGQQPGIVSDDHPSRVRPVEQCRLASRQASR